MHQTLVESPDHFRVFFVSAGSSSFCGLSSSLSGFAGLAKREFLRQVESILYTLEIEEE